MFLEVSSHELAPARQKPCPQTDSYRGEESNYRIRTLSAWAMEPGSRRRALENKVEGKRGDLGVGGGVKGFDKPLEGMKQKLEASTQHRFHRFVMAVTSTAAFLGQLETSR